MKFKVTEKIVAQIDWKIIGYQKTTNEIFNNSLSMSIDSITTYSNFNKFILKYGDDTKTTNNHKNKLWFHFSHESLLNLIDTRDALPSDYQNLGTRKG